MCQPITMTGKIEEMVRHEITEVQGAFQHSDVDLEFFLSHLKLMWKYVKHPGATGSYSTRASQRRNSANREYLSTYDSEEESHKEHDYCDITIFRGFPEGSHYNGLRKYFYLKDAEVFVTQTIQSDEEEELVAKEPRKIHIEVSEADLFHESLNTVNHLLPAADQDQRDVPLPDLPEISLTDDDQMISDTIDSTAGDSSYYPEDSDEEPDDSSPTMKQTQHNGPPLHFSKELQMLNHADESLGYQNKHHSYNLRCRRNKSILVKKNASLPHNKQYKRTDIDSQMAVDDFNCSSDDAMSSTSLMEKESKGYESDGWTTDAVSDMDEYVDSRTGEVNGPIEGYPPASWFPKRKFLSLSGVHCPVRSSIHYGPKGVYSLVLSKGTIVRDKGKYFIITGVPTYKTRSKRRRLKTHCIVRRTSFKIKCNQEMANANMALLKSLHGNLSVRIIRSYSLKNSFSPDSGYRYDGLYRVCGVYQEIMYDGILEYKFVFVDETEPTTPIGMIPVVGFKSDKQYMNTEEIIKKVEPSGSEIDPSLWVTNNVNEEDPVDRTSSNSGIFARVTCM